MSQLEPDLEGLPGELDPLEAPPPSFAAADCERIAADLFGIDGAAAPLDSERDQNMRITAADGSGFVLKISNPAEDPAFVDMQTQAMLQVARTDPDLPVMRIIPATDGRLQVERASEDGRAHIVRLVTLMPGHKLEPVQLDMDALQHFGSISARLGRALQGFFHPAAGHPLLWNIRHALALRPLVENIEDPARRAIVEGVLDRFQEHVHPVFDGLRGQVIHNDLTSDNTLFGEDLRVSGILDFGDMAYSALVCDLVSTVEALMGERPDPFETLTATAAGFISVTPLQNDEIELLPDLLLTRWATTAVISAWRVRRYPENAEYITGWDMGVWNMLESFQGMGASEYQRRTHEAIVAAGGAPRATPVHMRIEDMIERRRRLFGPAISPLTYDHPLHLVEGRGAWMVDADGRAYLDAYNNVPVVGHCHPHVVQAIARQAATLNTNTRYLHRSALDLAERLIETLPDGLDTVMFVNSGSEANDLAWRMASVVAGSTGSVVTEFAYHGVTAATSDLSPEEWLGEARPTHVATIPAPDAYRGRFREDDPAWPDRYAETVNEAIAALGEAGLGPAMLMLDTGFISDGVFAPPEGYLAKLVQRWRDAGGLFVADEVQVGYGRSGSHLWGFQGSGVTPDFVTLGKPMGNGHPVAAVITRADIAERFAAETEFFSTFGGNPVACEAGLAVLDVIEREGLIANAEAMGAKLGRGVRALAARHPSIGDVRAFGLLLGVELVHDRDTREPAPREADAILNEMRERGVLIGTTGPHGNILKIRPPLILTSGEADMIVDTLDEALSTLSRP